MSREKLEAGLAHHQAGKLDTAEAIYRDVLTKDQANADALHFLGLIFQQQGALDQAIEYIERAIVAEPDRPTFHFNLGVSYDASGEKSKAAAAYQKASALKPDWLDAFVSLGTILGQLRDFSPAEKALHQALELEPDNAAALIGLTAVLEGLGRSAEAEQMGLRAVQVSAKSPEAWTNLGNALNSQGREPGKLANAEEAFRRALALEPGYVTALFNLGNVLNDQWRKAEAMSCFKEVTKRDGSYQGASYQGAWQNRLMNLLYDPVETEQTIFAAHKDWASGFTASKSQPVEAAKNKRLKIGYVSPDFRTHSCAYFLKPLFAAHDRTAVEIFAYANVAKEDDMTAWFKAHVDHWCDVTMLSDLEMAARVQQDGIDILVDLAGHSAHNRLAVFALKPAPHQLSWLGYPATTGLSQIGYRLTDAVADPAGPADEYHSEQLVRLEGGFHCYQPPPDIPDIGPLPALEKGFVTFGSFNHIAKITPAVIETWAEILQAVPNSRLLLKGGMLDYAAVRDKISAAFESFGIAADRLDLKGWIARQENPLALYNSVDICLDTFPYNGTTTSFEALSMGVPVVTLRGTRHAARVGASILTALGHPEWIGDTTLNYIDISTGLAADLGALQACREALRAALAASSLGDGRGFASKIEAAYRDICAP